MSKIDGGTPVARVEKGLDTGAPDTESLTEKIAGRAADLQSVRGTNAQLEGEVVQLEAVVGVDPEAPTVLTQERAAMQEQSADRYDFNSVAKVFADLVTRMEAEGTSKERIAEAKEYFAKATAKYAQEKAGKSDPASHQWYVDAQDAFAVIPPVREAVDWNDPEAHKLDVPVGDRKFITQVRFKYVGLDGKLTSPKEVGAAVIDGAPTDVRKRFCIADLKERMQNMLDGYTKTAKQFHDYRTRIAESAALQGVDLLVIERELMKADALFAESQKVIDQTERMYRQRVLEMRILGDSEFSEEKRGKSKVDEINERTYATDLSIIADGKVRAGFDAITEFEKSFLRAAA